MATDIHAAALEQINVEIQRLESELAIAKAVANYHAARVAKTESADTKRERISKAVGNVQIREATAGSETPYAAMTQYEAAATVLRNAGKPLKTGEIADEMISGGFPQTDRKKLSISLFTSLLRKKDVFEKAGSGLWKLAN